MSIKEKLYTKILDILNVVRGYFLTELSGYQLRKNIEYADKFLAWFRSRTRYVVPGTAGKRNPDPDCKHLKGGQLKAYGTARDYNMLGHTFSDGSITIRCGNGCGFKSTPRDENWKDAVYMMEESSNRPSSSERVFPGANHGNYRSKATVVYQDKL